jgi:FAD synthetase
VAAMVKVMATGTFDILHLGHIYYLKEAKKLGGTLVVVVAHDKTVRKLKHEPINPGKIRVDLVKELSVVDEAYLGHEDNMYEIVKEIQPDIIALGFDQIHDEKEIQEKLQQMDLSVKVVRLKKYDGGSDLEGTRRIISKILTAYEFQKKMERLEQK